MNEPKPAPGFYFVGFVTHASRTSMTPAQRERWALNTAMSNLTPYETAALARRVAREHHLRDITIIEEKADTP